MQQLKSRSRIVALTICRIYAAACRLRLRLFLVNAFTISIEYRSLKYTGHNVQSRSNEKDIETQHHGSHRKHQFICDSALSAGLS